MIWPLELDLKDGQSYDGTLYGRPLALERRGMRLALGYDEHDWLVGIPENTQRLRLGPSLGPAPFLVFPTPPLVVPGGESIEQTFRVPLHLELAAVAETSVRLRELRPATLTRSLYGPVDGGAICWTVKALDEGVACLQLAGKTGDLTASLSATIENHTTHGHDVSKIMLPVDLIGLYDRSGELFISDVQMVLLGDTEAELTMESPAKARAMNNVLGVPIRPTRRSFALSHTYRNKTGLEYGF